MDILGHTLWLVFAPLRAVMGRVSHAHRGGFVVRVLLAILTRMPGSFIARLPHGGTISLFYNSIIGKNSLLFGLYEKEEIVCLINHVRPHTSVIDVGANIGLFSIPLARALQHEGDGTVFSVEPIEENRTVLIRNMERNSLTNVHIVNAAAGEGPGNMTLFLPHDLACTSSQTKDGDVKKISVPVTTLDTIWTAANKPDISVIKIDVEGAELSVLKGAREIIKTCRPLLLIEANDARHYDILHTFLTPLGYFESQPSGFSEHNYLFSPDTA